MTEQTITTLIIASISSITTIICTIIQSRQSKKHAAKQSILQMIIEDQFNWQGFKKAPNNYGNILDEYVVYHKNGGNGEITKRVEDYKKWHEDVAQTIASKC